MSDLNQEQVIEFLSGLTVMDLVKLTETLEEKWGVKAAPVAAAAAPAAEGGASAEEQTEFTVVLKKFDNKMAAIKAVKEITGEGLKQCKELVEGAPSDVKVDISKEAAAEIAEKLKAAGCEVEVK